MNRRPAPRRRTRSAVLAALALPLILSACSTSPDEEPADPGSTTNAAGENKAPAVKVSELGEGWKDATSNKDVSVEVCGDSAFVAGEDIEWENGTDPDGRLVSVGFAQTSTPTTSARHVRDTFADCATDYVDGIDYFAQGIDGKVAGSALGYLAAVDADGYELGTAVVAVPVVGRFVGYAVVQGLPEDEAPSTQLPVYVEDIADFLYQRALGAPTSTVTEFDDIDLPVYQLPEGESVEIVDDDALGVIEPEVDPPK